MTHSTALNCHLQCCRFLASWGCVSIGTSSLRRAVVFSGGSLCEIMLTVMLIMFEDMLMFSCEPFLLYCRVVFYYSFLIMFIMLMR